MTEPEDDATIPGQLLYLYVGTADIEADLNFYREVCGAESLWQVQAFGTEVAAIRIGGEVALVLAAHRPVPSCMPIWSVRDLDGLVRYLRAAGWGENMTRVEIPDGPCVVMSDRSGNEMGLLQQDRPDAIGRRLASGG